MKIEKEKKNHKYQIPIQMQINRKLFLIFFLTVLILNLFSCQTKEVISLTKYQNLTSQNKQEINEYLEDAKKIVSKKDNEIALMFQYNCFFGKEITVNNIYNKDFPKIPGKADYGQRIVNYAKSLGKIKIKLSNGKRFLLSQKIGYDYITICYNEKSEVLYIHYYDFPKMLIEE